MKVNCILLHLALIFSFSSNIVAQEKNDFTSLINGKIHDLINSKPIENVLVEIYLCELNFTENGIPIIGPNSNGVKIKTMNTTADGKFEANINIREKKDYIFIKVSNPKMESMYKNHITVENEEEIFLEFKMTPLNPTSKEKEIIEKKSIEEYKQKEVDKMKDLNNVAKIDKEKVPNKNKKKVSTSLSSASSSSCSYSSIPTNVYVSNLQNGYNGSSSGSGYTGYINFDLYVGGVVQGEIGGITSNIDTKKAQAVAARTFSLNRHTNGWSVNVGQAYNDSPGSSSSTSSSSTTEEVILYNGSVIDAKYSARCNGNYTQNANEGTWSPYSTCNTSGSYIPYLLSVGCSGHINCNQTSESPCCNASISTTNSSGYIYGHGVGMCQRGIEQFGEIYGWDYCQMLQHYYTNICVANSSCSGTSNVGLDCSSSINLTCGVTYFGSSSSSTSQVSSYGCNTWTETGPERVHTITPSANGTITATLSNFSGDLDVYILGSCDPSDCLGTVNSSSATYTNAQANQTYYIVVDADDGSGSAYNLIVTCPDPDPCNAGIITSSTSQTICPDESFNLALNGSQEAEGGFNIRYSNTGTNGTGGTNGVFNITGYTASSFPYTADNDLNGILSANSLPLLEGTWNIAVYALDGTGATCDFTSSISVTFLSALDASCVPSATCEAGIITSSAPQTICPDENFNIILDGSQEAEGGFKINYSNTGTNGTGGTNAGLNITGYTASSFPYAANNDLNGILSANSLPPLEGTWNITVYALDQTDGICDITSTISVTFLSSLDASCISATCEAGIITSSAPQTICPDETFNIILDGSQEAEGGFKINYSNTGTNGTGGTNAGINITGYTASSFPYAANNDLNGILSTNSLPPLEGTWNITVYALDATDETCDITSSISVTFLSALDASCVSSYTISTTSNPTNGGTTSGSGNYNSGTSITVSANANSGWIFTNWTENGTIVSSNSSYQFSVNSNRNLVANFSQNTYTITTASNPINGGTTSGGGSYSSGTNVTVSANANSGWIFTNWTENGTIVSNNSSYQFSVNSNRNLVANFSQNTYTITTASTPINGGTTSGGGSYSSGTNITVSANANSGWIFTNWTENGAIVSNNSSYQITVNSNRNLVANFSQNTYTITTTSNPTNGGTTSGNGSYSSGTNITISANANSGWIFTNWTENGAIVSNNSSYQITVNSNRNLVANFIENVVSCSIPTNITVEMTSSTNAFVSWDAVAGADYYQVWYRPQGTSSWSIKGTAATQRNIPDLTPNLEYQYKIRARCAGDTWSDYSEIVTLYSTICNIPTNITVEVTSSTNAFVSWGAVAGADYYQVWYKQQGTSSWSIKGTAATQRNIPDLIPNLEYQYKVRARCAGETWSDYSEIVTLYNIFCGIPAGITADITSPTVAAISWDAVSGADYYQVRYRLKGTSSWTVKGTAATQKNISDLTPNKYYQYKLRARCTGEIWSDFSDIQLLYSSICDIPTGISSIYLDNNRMRIRWDNTTEVKARVAYREVGTSTWYTKNSQSGNNFVYITGLTPNAQYEYRVRSNCQGTDWSAYSDKYYHNLGSAREMQEATIYTSSKIYPNPVQNILNIEFSENTEGKTHISIMDNLGREKYGESITIQDAKQYENIDISNLPNGYYFLVISNDEHTEVLKFMKIE